MFLRGYPLIVSTRITKQQIRELVAKPNPVILEIGCNNGEHTLMFLEIFENPSIYCFEPELRAIERFKEKVGHRSNVELFEMAISDHNGEIYFYQSGGQKDEKSEKAMPKGWGFSGSIRQPHEHINEYPWVTFEISITVKSTTLDAWCQSQGISGIDFIWMGCSGRRNWRF